VLVFCIDGIIDVCHQPTVFLFCGQKKKPLRLLFYSVELCILEFSCCSIERTNDCSLSYLTSAFVARMLRLCLEFVCSTSLKKHFFVSENEFLIGLRRGFNRVDDHGMIELERDRWYSSLSVCQNNVTSHRVCGRLQ
jgi:hypothetical protein